MNARTLLFIGAGPDQRRALIRVRELGARVVAVDGHANAAGFALADVVEVVDFADVDAVVDVARRHAVDGVMTVASDRAVPTVAAVAAELGLPGIGRDTAYRMTNKIAMRRALAEAGVPQPRFAAVRTLHEARLAAERIGFPAVMKAADAAGQRGLFLLTSVKDVELHLHASLAASPSQEAIIESFHAGLELNALLVARDGEPTLVTLSDRLRPQGRGFGVALTHVYPSTLSGDALEEVRETALRTVRAVGLRNGIASPQILWGDDGVSRLVEVAARILGGQMTSVAQTGVGIDLVHVALLQAFGEPIPDELLAPSTEQPHAVAFLTAEPGPLPTGHVERVSGLERVLAFPGVVEAEVYLEPGETIRPVQVDADRRGFVIALGATNLEAVERAEAAASLLDVEVSPVRSVAPGSEGVATCTFDLAHYGELLRAAQAGGYRFALFEGDPEPGDLLLRHDVDFSLPAAVRLAELEAAEGARATYMLMRESVFYNLESDEGRWAFARLRALGHRIGLHAVWPRAELDDRFDPIVAWHNPEPPYMSDPVAGAVNAMGPPWFAPGHYRSDSNQRWRIRCPHEELARGQLDWLQLMTHPEIWVYPGATMLATMLAMLDAERDRRLKQLAADRIDLS